MLYHCSAVRIKWNNYTNHRTTFNDISYPYKTKAKVNCNCFICYDKCLCTNPSITFLTMLYIQIYIQIYIVENLFACSHFLFNYLLLFFFDFVLFHPLILLSVSLLLFYLVYFVHFLLVQVISSCFVCLLVLVGLEVTAGDAENEIPHRVRVQGCELLTT